MIQSTRVRMPRRGFAPDMPTPKPKPTIGWREWIGLPDLGIASIKAKIDTGARSSALHAFELETVRRGGLEFASFLVHPIQRETRSVIPVEAQIVEYRSIRSSNGASEDRPVIVTTVEWRALKWPVELTLTRRDEMGFRLLLGRQAVRHRFLVDAGGSYYSEGRSDRDSPANENQPRPPRTKP